MVIIDSHITMAEEEARPIRYWKTVTGVRSSILSGISMYELCSMCHIVIETYGENWLMVIK